ncbi:hypothetical protein H8A95_36980 [Bradyrhizobium sp. Pear76]|uniref:hypothetical protein n=1 Tax=Bradyrhizobium oropedii TaxID=1571201 RepID=UPI001E53C694|nr:hypothetical protein [Bradyrhizobium oropedii]MCC8967756.1 hypothetical protein [Bradyrhizobium oropedii]
MPVWFDLLQACWVIGFMILGFWIWILGKEVRVNVLAGVSKWKHWLLRGMPARDELNERGRILRRRYYRLVWIMIPYFLGGGLLFRYLKTHL